ncbi:MAG: hypothetical protein AB7P76_06225 [Candidatus Melainabacteria bacterium]
MPHTPHNGHDCGHDHGDESPLLVYVTEVLDDGTPGETFAFEKIDTFEIDEQEYALMALHTHDDEDEVDELPDNVRQLHAPEDDEEEEEVFVMKINHETNEEGAVVEVYEQLSEDEYEHVSQFLENMMGEAGDDDDDEVVIDLEEILKLKDAPAVGSKSGTVTPIRPVGDEH